MNKKLQTSLIALAGIVLAGLALFAEHRDLIGDGSAEILLFLIGSATGVTAGRTSK